MNTFTVSVRLLIEDVTLTRGDKLLLGIHFRSGMVRQISIEPEKRHWEQIKTPPEVVAEVDRLLDEHTESEIAVILNECGQDRL